MEKGLYFSTNGAGATGYPFAKKKKSIHTLNHIYEVNPIAPKITKFLEERIAETLCDFSLGQDLDLKSEA